MANDNQARTIQGVTYGTAIVRISHTDLTAAAATETIAWADLRAAHPDALAGNIPANARLMYAYVNLIEVFAGGSAATATLGAGDTALPAELIAAHNVFTGAPLGVGTTAGAFALGTLESDYDGDGAGVTITITGDTVDNLTTGEADVCVIYQSLTTDSLTG
jgi:hypothetical protein